MNADKHWGAYPSDWHLLDLALGLGADLLPVVSNPEATISENSAIKDLGKTPSRYNRSGEAVGIPGWTQHTASDADIRRWSKEPDYGICIITRRLRAIDIDVPDRELAAQIEDFISDKICEMGLGAPLPKRWRANSGKCLLAFYLEGDFKRRKFTVRDKVVDEKGKVVELAWLVEFLATGQQFVAFGTHPSGARIEWDWGGHDDFPTLEAHQFEALWAALQERFALPGSSTIGGGARKIGADLGIDDPVAQKLNVLGEGPDGQLYIECPWSAEHSSDTGIGQCCYFPAGTRGYERGHFHCLHASHHAKTDIDFLVALGLDDREDDLADLITQPSTVVDPVTGEQKEEELPEGLPMLIRDGKGRIEAIPANVRAILERPDVVGIEIAHDAFRDEVMCRRHGIKQGGWVNFTDEDYTRIRIQFDHMRSKPVGRELARDCLALVAKQNQFDSAIAWLEGLEWDGVPRIENFAVRYLGAENTPYARSLSRYLWTALAGRCLEPGIKADMAPILVGEQDLGKSSLIKAIVPDPQFFVELDLKAHDDNNARNMKGCLVAELAELKGLASRDLESIKAFMTRTHEKWVPKFKEMPITYGRRLVFIGTSNQDEFLGDTTGNRRWLPIVVSTCDVEGVKRDRLQLWAEARELFKEVGIAYQEVNQLSSAEHAKYEIRDAWDDAVADWLTQPVNGDMPTSNAHGPTNGDQPRLRMVDIAKEALNIDSRNLTRGEQRRLGSTLRRLGYEKDNERVGGKVNKVWKKVSKGHKHDDLA